MTPNMSTTAIITRLDHYLAPLGFKRRKTVWNRACDQFVDVIDIQCSKGKSAATVNAGVLERGVYATCWGREVGSFVEEPFCTVRARIGNLFGNLDKWWDLKGVDTVNEMTESVKVHAIPFVERMHNLNRMIEWLALTGSPSPKTPLSAIFFAVLHQRTGNVQQACSILADLQAKVRGAWNIRVREVSERIGCA